MISSIVRLKGESEEYFIRQFTFPSCNINFQQPCLSIHLLYFCRWVNSPPCDKCGGGTNSIGMGNPDHSEIEFGGRRVELYRYNKEAQI